MTTKQLLLCSIFSWIGLAGAAQAGTAPPEHDGEAAAGPIACRLNALTPTERDRSRRLRAEFIEHITEVKGMTDGFDLTYDGDPQTFQTVAEWITLERRCCPFLNFTLSWPRGEGTHPTLSLTGPKGTKEFLEAQIDEVRKGS
jgi:hypothetical protein